MKIGDIKITPIHDASTEVDLNTMFCSGLNIEPYRSLLTENGQYRIPMGGFLIEKEILQDGKTKPAKILVDVGQGLPAFSPAFGHFLDNFQKLGISPNDITDIIFTHLHMDHIGWAVDVTDNNKIVFPNAEYWIHVADLDHFLSQESQFPGVISVKERLTPILNSPEKCKVHKIPKNQEITEIYPGINIRFAPGHTPGEILVEILEGNTRVLLLGDVVHHPAELVDETWIFNAAGSDFDQKMAQQTRKIWCQEVRKPNTIITAAHFPDMQFGRIVKAENSNGCEKYEYVKFPDNYCE